MNEGPAKLSSDAQRLWQEYLATENSGIRDSRRAALDRFIDVLLQSDEETWQSWARDFAAQVFSGAADVPVRWPLFRRVLLPALAEGVMRETPGCARVLASFDQLLLKVKDSPLPKELASAIGLLREALRLDPADRQARDLLVEHWAHYLQYSIHELPAGVLYGYDGASLDECDQLLALLEEFRGHVEALQQQERFADLIARCELHFNAYRDYLSEGCPTGSYRAFLEDRGLPARWLSRGATG